MATLTDVKAYNRAGAVLNLSAGVATLASTSTLDTGTVRITGKVAGVWTQEDVQLNGTTPVSSDNNWDAGEVWRWEYLDGIPVGNIACAVNGEVVACIFGSASQFGCWLATAEVRLALAVAVDTQLDAANRTEAPSPIGSWERAVWFTGRDTRLSLGDDLASGSFLGFALELTGLAGIPAPFLGYLTAYVALTGGRTGGHPTDAELAYFGGLATPTNDTDPIGGAPVDGGAELDQTTPNLLIADLVVEPYGGSPVVVYGVGYRENISA